MTLAELNAAADDEALATFTRCCGAGGWARTMVAARPFNDPASLLAHADAIWRTGTPADWREAFTHHPRIGDREGLRAKFASTATWAEGEQAGTAAATDAVLDALAAGNAAYEAKFGHIFIVCATGKRADEMLALLEARLPNGPEAEVANAAEEQRKITAIRLTKLLEGT